MRIATGEELAAIPGDANGLAFSPDGAVLAIAQQRGIANGRLLVWDIARKVARHTIDRDTVVTYVAVSGDGTLIAATEARAVSIWEASSGTRLGGFTPDGELKGVAFRSDGSLFVAADGGTSGSLSVYTWPSSRRVDRRKPLHGYGSRARTGTTAAMRLTASGSWRSLSQGKLKRAKGVERPSKHIAKALNQNRESQDRSAGSGVRYTPDVASMT